MYKQVIQTDAAPRAIGNYSQAIRVGNTVYLSGQIPLEPATMEMAAGIEAQVHRVFQNIAAVVSAAGGTMDHIVKLNIFLTDLANFGVVNDIMACYFRPPYPARAVVGVAALPRAARVEVEAVMVLTAI